MLFPSEEVGHHLLQAQKQEQKSCWWNREVQHVLHLHFTGLKSGKVPGGSAPFWPDHVRVLNRASLCLGAKFWRCRASRTGRDASFSTLCIPGWEDLAAHPVSQTLPDSPGPQGQHSPSPPWSEASPLTSSSLCFSEGTWSICSSSSLGAGQLKLAGRAKAAEPLIWGWRITPHLFPHSTQLPRQTQAKSDCWAAGGGGSVCFSPGHFLLHLNFTCVVVWCAVWCGCCAVSLLPFACFFAFQAPTSAQASF